MTDIVFHGDFLSRLDLTDIQLAMIGKRHDPDTLLSILNGFPLEEYFYEILSSKRIETCKSAD